MHKHKGKEMNNQNCDSKDGRLVKNSKGEYKMLKLV